jgi:hypothetical protein
MEAQRRQCPAVTDFGNIKNRQNPLELIKIKHIPQRIRYGIQASIRGYE